MRIFAAAAIVLSFLVGPLAGAASWTHVGGDAGRTRYSTDSLPLRLEYGLVADLGAHNTNGEIIVLDGVAYVTTARGVVRVDPATGEVSDLAPIDRFAYIVADERHIFVVDASSVSAYSPSGEKIWSTPLPRDETLPVTESHCPNPAVNAEGLFIQCQDRSGDADGRSVPAQSVYTFRIDPDRGQISWVEREQQSSILPALPPVGHTVGTVSLGRERVLSGFGEGVTAGFVVVAREALSGRRVWSASTSPDPSSTDLITSPVPRFDPSLVAAWRPTIVGDVAYIHAGGELRAVALDDGSRLWGRAINQTLAGAHGHAAGSIYYMNGPDLHAVDVDASHADQIVRTAEGTPCLNLVLAGDGSILIECLVRRASNAVEIAQGDVELVRHVYTAAGEDAWRQELPSAAAASWIAFADGLVLYTFDDTLYVIGRPAGAIQPRLRISDDYPTQGQRVQIDATGTLPGVQAPDVLASVEWGDGTTSEEGPPGVFEHAYDRTGEFTATLRLRNAVGQTAIETATFHVGGSPPLQPGIVMTAFSDRYQNLTFFLVGLAVTAIGGVFGIVRPRRRRAKTRALLAAVDALHERTKADPLACEAALKGELRRTRATLLGGGIDEDQANAVALHIQDLVGSARLRLVTSRYSELPPRALAALQGTLADGVVTRVERDQVVAALASERGLSDAERARLVALIDSWFSADAPA